MGELKDRWWKNKAGDCPPDEVSSDELDIRKLGGVFVTLLVGLGAAWLWGIGEFIGHSRQVAIRRKV